MVLPTSKLATTSQVSLEFFSKLVHMFKRNSTFSQTWSQTDKKKQSDTLTSKFCLV